MDEVYEDYRLAMGILNSLLALDDLDMHVDGAIRTAMILLDTDANDPPELLTESRKYARDAINKMADEMQAIIDRAERSRYL